MRIIRLFQPGTYQVPETITLNEKAAHHATVVLRLKSGSHITLFNGKNEEFDGTIVTINKKKVLVSLTKQRHVDRESPCKIHLGQAIIKGDRMEWLIQKAVELGVDQITPLISDHIAVSYDEKRMAKKMEQWKGIIVSACEQSGRNLIPGLNSPLPSKIWFKQTHPQPLILLPGSVQRINKQLTPKDNTITIAVGPEGGWSHNEESQSLAHQWHSVALGPRTLRAETATICALTLLQGSMGDI